MTPPDDVLDALNTVIADNGWRDYTEGYVLVALLRDAVAEIERLRERVALTNQTFTEPLEMKPQQPGRWEVRFRTVTAGGWFETDGEPFEVTPGSSGGEVIARVWLRRRVQEGGR